MMVNNLITRENARINTLLNKHVKTLPHYVDEYVRSKLRAGLSNKTLLQYVYKYIHFFDWLISENIVEASERRDIPYTELEKLKKEDIELYIDHLKFENISNFKNTVKQRGSSDVLTFINALRALFKYLTVETEKDNGECYFYRNVMNKVVFNKQRETANKRARKINAHILSSSEEIAGLLNFIKEDYEYQISAQQKERFRRDKERDIAIISLILGSGIRVNEVASLELKNVNLKKNIIDVTRKGNKEDSVMIMDQAREDLEVYLRVRNERYRKASECPFVFVTIYQRQAKEISKRAIQKLVTKYTAAFNNNSGISPQKLRHSFATDYIKNNGNIVTLRDQLGHSDIKTTSLYTNMSNEDNIKTLNIMNEHRNASMQETNKNE